MGEAEKHVDSETYNLLVEASMEHRITFCLWGNVVKNPRCVCVCVCVCGVEGGGVWRWEGCGEPMVIKDVCKGVCTQYGAYFNNLKK